MSIYYVSYRQHAVSTIQVLAQGSTTNSPQSTQVEATTLKPQISTTLSPTFSSKYTPLSPSCATRSQIKSSTKSLPISILIPLVKKRGGGGTTCEWDLPHIFYRYLVLNIAHLTITYTYKLNKDNMEGQS
jgi:hypothetical protein